MANMSLKKQPMPEQDPRERARNFHEVALGYSPEMAQEEAQRCLHCKNAPCVTGCPVNVPIPDFIDRIKNGDFTGACQVIRSQNALPAICGRVCPQESQCEGCCVLGKKFDAIAIGKLERFVGDWSRENHLSFSNAAPTNGHKVAVVGSGPAGITCAKELLMKGYEVTVYEALHEYGGVLTYGIPSFRLPKETVVKHEIENVERLGTHFVKDVVVKLSKKKKVNGCLR